jgi:hypothetical protein
MRRFIASLPGKVLSHVVITALMVPYVALGLATRSVAQVKQLPSWAVADFVDKKGKTAFGAEAAKAVANSLGKTGKYDVQPQETVARVAEGVGLTQPLEGRTNLMAVGRELKVSTIVSGEIIDYRVDESAAGKQARVSMKVIAYDVAAQEPVNGAAVAAFSTVRGRDVASDVLINDAIAQAATLAVDKINQQSLPTGTILNTGADVALLNQGSRTGFKDGQEVIISRGREQVASGVVFDLSADKSYIRVKRSFKGIQPGDKVRAIFQVPDITPKWNPDGTPSVARTKSKGVSSNLVTTLLVLGLVAFLVGGSGGRGGEVLQDVTAEAYSDPTNGPSVRVSWMPNAFAKGNQMRQFWQIFRNDFFDVPVRIAIGGNTSALDNTTPVGSVTYSTLTSPPDFNVCSGNSTTTASNISGVTPGRPYQYAVSLVFSMTQSDLPGGSSGGGNGATTGGGLTTGGATTGGATTGGATTGGATTGGATTGGATTGGATTGGATTGSTTTGATTSSTAATTGGATGGGNGTCFFLSPRTTANGYATPLNRPGLVAPASNATLQNPQQFTFLSVANPLYDITVEYVIQVSSTLNFAKNTYIQRTVFQRRDTGTLATQAIDLNDTSLPSSILTATTLYWRIGAKNIIDVPGPVPDDFTQQRYIFSVVNQLTRPGAPPPPPTN